MVVPAACLPAGLARGHGPVLPTGKEQNLGVTLPAVMSFRSRVPALELTPTQRFAQKIAEPIQNKLMPLRRKQESPQPSARRTAMRSPAHSAPSLADAAGEKSCDAISNSHSPNSGRGTRSIPNIALTKALTPTSRANHLPVHTKVQAPRIRFAAVCATRPATARRLAPASRSLRSPPGASREEFGPVVRQYRTVRDLGPPTTS